MFLDLCEDKMQCIYAELPEKVGGFFSKAVQILRWLIDAANQILFHFAGGLILSVILGKILGFLKKYFPVFHLK